MHLKEWLNKELKAYWGLFTVDKSPSEVPDKILLNKRLTIFPLLVFGNSETKMTYLGTAIGPICFLTLNFTFSSVTTNFESEVCLTTKAAIQNLK